MKKIEAQIVADSINPQGNRITSFILTYPRFIHGELMTHRMFSRNSASSRAIPFKKMVEMVKTDPFIPIAWQSKHTGMQGHEYLDGDSEQKLLINKWLEARDLAVQQAKLLDNSNVTKQLCNRLLEPFMWHTTLVTTTEISNFFELRCPKYQTPVSRSVEPQRSWKDLTEVHSNPENLKRLEENKDNWIFKMQHSLSAAEIHIQALAEAMWDAMNESKPKQLRPLEWHIPFGDILIPEFDYTKTREIDKDFHKKRLMFIVKDGEIEFAPRGCEQSHFEYFGKIEGLTRGFELDGCVYTYKDNFIPIESDEIKNKFKDFKLFAGAKDFFNYQYGDNKLIKIATARCARLSYMTFEGEINYVKDIALHDQLLAAKHASPFEHCCRAMTEEEHKTLGKMVLNLKNGYVFENGWIDNFKGFISYRRVLNF